MLATFTNAKFSVPENPVMRAMSGFGLLQEGNGYAMGQSVDLVGSNGNMRQTTDSQGRLIWAGGEADGSPFTADYCNKIITGGTATVAEKFQCSLRGYVGAAAVYATPPALVPAPPTSVTIPLAMQRVNDPRPVPVRPVSRCAQQAIAQGDDNTMLYALGALVIGYLVFGGAK